MTRSFVSIISGERSLVPTTRSTVPRISPVPSRFLHTFGINQDDLHRANARRYSSDSRAGSLVQYKVIKEMPNSMMDEVVSGFSSELEKNCDEPLIDIKNPQAIRFGMRDIPVKSEDNFGQIILASSGDKNEVVIRYGAMGVAPSAEVAPADLLKHQIKIPERSIVMLKIKKHVPFVIQVKNKEKAVAVALNELEMVDEHDKNISRYSLDVDYSLDPEDAKRHTLTVQNRIVNDSSKERFFQELTAVVDKPTRHNRSSGTLMEFGDVEGIQSTDMHYHPGDRVLQIITTDKKAGVTLNFCGIAEKPSERPDCQVHLEFPKNTVLTLKFPSATHHKFDGNFVCKSFHPQDGKNIIKALENSGTLPAGFITTATIISEGCGDKWNSPPIPQKTDKSL